MIGRETGWLGLMTFFCLAFFVFFVFWRPQDWLWPWLFGFPILDIVFCVALLSYLGEIQVEREQFPRNAPQPLLLLGLFVAAMMSHIAHTYFEGLMDTIPEVFKICCFTALLVFALKNVFCLRSMAFIFVVMACVMAVNSLMQERYGYGFVGSRPMYIDATETTEAHVRTLFFGIFEDPNDLAQILATSIPFAFALPRRLSLLGLLFAGSITWLLVLAILSTHSRGGIVGLAATASVMVALVLPAKWLPRITMLLIIMGLFLCPLTAPFLDASAHDRVVFWGLANEQFKNNPLFGLGYGMFWQVASDRAAHNSFVYCYTELGMFGYFFWFSLLQVGFVGAWKTMMRLRGIPGRDEAWLRRFAGLCVAALAGFAASGYFLSRAFVYPLFFLFAMLGALPFVAGKYLQEGAPPILDVRKDTWVWPAVGSAASIIYIYFSILLLNKAFGAG